MPVVYEKRTYSVKVGEMQEVMIQPRETRQC